MMSEANPLYTIEGVNTPAPWYSRHVKSPIAAFCVAYITTLLLLVSLLSFTAQPSTNLLADLKAQDATAERLKENIKAFESRVKALQDDRVKRIDDLKAEGEKERKALQDKLSATKKETEKKVNKAKADIDAEIKTLQDKIKTAKADMEKATKKAAEKAAEKAASGVQEGAAKAEAGVKNLGSTVQKAARDAERAAEKTAGNVQEAAGGFLRRSQGQK